MKLIFVLVFSAFLNIRSVSSINLNRYANITNNDKLSYQILSFGICDDKHRISSSTEYKSVSSNSFLSCLSHRCLLCSEVCTERKPERTLANTHGRETISMLELFQVLYHELPAPSSQPGPRCPQAPRLCPVQQELHHPRGAEG